MKDSTFPVIITDLDGTLLDHSSYDFSAAGPALALILRRNIPLVLCSSKTAAEIRHLQVQIGIRDPFIAENGGALYLPVDSGNQFSRQALGVTVEELRPILTELESSLHMRFLRFEELSEEILAHRFGLSPCDAGRAQRREFDLPFQITSGEQKIDLLRREVEKRGLRLSQGGRLFHLTGHCDKGRAVRRLVEWYRKRKQREVFTIGLGDSLNDLSLLQSVDLPVIIPNPESQAPLAQELPSAVVAPNPGPQGWNAVVLSILESENPGSLRSGLPSGSRGSESGYRNES